MAEPARTYDTPPPLGLTLVRPESDEVVTADASGFYDFVPTQPDPFEVIQVVFGHAPESVHTMPGVSILDSDEPTLGSSVVDITQRQHTRVYLQEGFIDESKLDKDGLYIDEYEGRSKRFLVLNGSKVASARLITADKRGLMSLPTMESFQVDGRTLAEVAHVPSVADIKPGDVAEVSALVREAIPSSGEKGGAFDAVIALYCSMLAESLGQGHKLWVMNIEPGFVRMLRGMIDGVDDQGRVRENVRVLGDAMEHMGPATVPVALSPADVVRTLLSATNPRQQGYADHLRACLRGVDARNIPEDIQALLQEQGVELHHESRRERVARVLRSRHSLIMAGVVVFTAGRDIIAAHQGGFTGNAPILFTGDQLTGVAYGWGLPRMYDAPTLKQRATAAGVTVTSFLAPYGYYFANQSRNGYPLSVKIGMTLLLGSMASVEVGRRMARSRRESRLLRALGSSALGPEHS